MDAFDADVLIFAASPGHELGRSVRTLFAAPIDASVGVGSVLLLPELLSRPMRDGASGEVEALAAILSRLDLRPVDEATAALAAALAAAHGLRAADAVHLATGVIVGADRFVTNNRRDFRKSIPEIDVAYPEDL